MSMLKAKQIKLGLNQIVVGSNAGNGKVLAAPAPNQFLSLVGSDVGYNYVSSLRNAAGDPMLSIVGNGTDTPYQITLPSGYAPTSEDSLTTVKFVTDRIETAAQGLDVKASVRAIATGNVALTGPQTVDGVALVEGDRVLLTGQTVATENGIYIVGADALTRAEDFDGDQVSPNAYTFVEEGSLGDTGWVLTTNGPITVGDTPLSFTQFSTAGVFKAGEGLVQDGLNFNVNVSEVTTTILDDKVVVKSSGTAGHIMLSAGSGEAAWGALDLANGDAIDGILPAANGGLGLNAATLAAGSLLVANGSGLVSLTAGADNTVLMGGTTPAFGYVQSLRNGAGLETLKVDTSGGTANVLTVMTGGDVALVASGGDEDIDLVLEPKGDGHVLAPSGYILDDTAPVEAFVTKGYVDNLSGTETGDDDLVYAGDEETATATLTGFFSNAPLEHTIAVFFNGIKLLKDVVTVTGTDLALDMAAIGYSLEDGDVISASYEYK